MEGVGDRADPQLHLAPLQHFDWLWSCDRFFPIQAQTMGSVNRPEKLNTTAFEGREVDKDGTYVFKLA